MADHSKQCFVRWYLDLSRSLGAGIINVFFIEHAHTLCFLQCLSAQQDWALRASGCDRPGTWMFLVVSFV